MMPSYSRPISVGDLEGHRFGRRFVREDLVARVYAALVSEVVAVRRLEGDDIATANDRIARGDLDDGESGHFCVIHVRGDRVAIQHPADGGMPLEEDLIGAHQRATVEVTDDDRSGRR